MCFNIIEAQQMNKAETKEKRDNICNLDNYVCSFKNGNHSLYKFLLNQQHRYFSAGQFVKFPEKRTNKYEISQNLQIIVKFFKIFFVLGKCKRLKEVYWHVTSVEPFK